ncbi:hypothetical protein DFH08DRAFT_100196 [Mycena albidolilacea]|uniref:Uncharacterized protein n=1 Tax=Mycena albidolilacea TaxID=1033008 RepID=A0AAD7A8L6_9AGAR|nr:hypothetical protein DFH08DRAFT_100196 [Mycena albidolilacea]
MAVSRRRHRYYPVIMHRPSSRTVVLWTFRSPRTHPESTPHAPSTLLHLANSSSQRRSARPLLLSVTYTSTPSVAQDCCPGIPEYPLRRDGSSFPACVDTLCARVVDTAPLICVLCPSNGHYLHVINSYAPETACNTEPMSSCFGQENCLRVCCIWVYVWGTQQRHRLNPSRSGRRSCLLADLPGRRRRRPFQIIFHVPAGTRLGACFRLCSAFPSFLSPSEIRLFSRSCPASTPAAFHPPRPNRRARIPLESALPLTDCILQRIILVLDCKTHSICPLIFVHPNSLLSPALWLRASGFRCWKYGSDGSAQDTIGVVSLARVE